MRDRECFVYVLRDGSGVIAYVGSTVNVRKRLRDHATKAWWLEIDQTATEVFTVGSDAAAAALEGETIALHAPRFNRAGVTSHYIPYRIPEPRGPREPRPPVTTESIEALRKVAALLADADAERAALMRERDRLIRAARDEGRHWNVIQETAGLASPRAVALALKRTEP